MEGGYANWLRLSAETQLQYTQARCARLGTAEARESTTTQPQDTCSSPQRPTASTLPNGAPSHLSPVATSYVMATLPNCQLVLAAALKPADGTHSYFRSHPSKSSYTGSTLRPAFPCPAQTLHEPNSVMTERSEIHALAGKRRAFKGPGGR